MDLGACPLTFLLVVLLKVSFCFSCRFSFCSDVVSGLHFLHSRDVVHANVKSNNCVVDDRWTVKLTG